MVRVAQIVEFHFDIRVSDHPLENLPIRLEECGSSGVSLVQRLVNRPLQIVTVYQTPDSHEQPELPFGPRLASLCKPYI